MKQGVALDWIELDWMDDCWETINVSSLLRFFYIYICICETTLYFLFILSLSNGRCSRSSICV